MDFVVSEGPPMTIEALVPEIVKTLRGISPWPWEFRDISTSKTDDGLGFVSDLNGVDFSHHGTNSKTKVQNITDGVFIASSPLWLAQMVVEIIILQKRIIRYRMTKAGFPEWDLSSREKDIEAEALRDFGLTLKDWQWLKGKTIICE